MIRKDGKFRLVSGKLTEKAQKRFTCLLATPPNVYSLVITGKRKTTMIVMFVIMKKRKGVAFIFLLKYSMDWIGQDEIPNPENFCRKFPNFPICYCCPLDENLDDLPLQATISAPKTQSGFSARTPHLISLLSSNTLSYIKTLTSLSGNRNTLTPEENKGFSLVCN